MNITREQRKVLWICLAVLVGSYVAHSVITAAMQAVYSYQQQAMRAAQRQNAKPSPIGRPVAVLGAAAGTSLAAPDPNAAIARLAGHWQGSVALPGRGVWGLKLELAENRAKEGEFEGFSSFTCAPTMFALMGSDPRMNAATAADTMSKAMNPAAAILAGAVTDGSLRFHVVKAIGRDASGCAITSLIVTPFGTNQAAAEWQDTPCNGGQMVLRRTGQ